ncbi:hypothetical protein MKX01_024945 [Papaver californicum]|nr:hypothetical protein MKX01_024945 [Papaver californicum]
MVIIPTTHCWFLFFAASVREQDQMVVIFLAHLKMISDRTLKMTSETQLFNGTNLDVKSKLHQDVALQQFFRMNNIYYMVQKVKGPELRPLFGNDWIKQHNRKFQQYAMNYKRATWNSIL